MTNKLRFQLDWQPLSEGSPEEKACFATLGLAWNDIWLTEGRDSFVNSVRQAPLLSAYHLAEWMVWNWWRLRWEPSAPRRDGWEFAHKVSTIGEGYVWPNITVFSDGERIALVTKPTNDQSSFRYINDVAAVVVAKEWEGATDQFVSQTIARLDEQGQPTTNLHLLWRDLLNERSDPSLSTRRRIEAMLGFEPGEAPDKLMADLLADAAEVGPSAVGEMAADKVGNDQPMSVAYLKQLAASAGYSSSARAAFSLAPHSSLPKSGVAPAWKLGAAAAQAVREQAALGTSVLSDARLCELSGVDKIALEDGSGGTRISFALDRTAQDGKTVLRSKWKEGRRFELARLLGDRLVGADRSRLFIATRSYTYDQQAQRAFAAELLSPFDAVDAIMDGDYSQEKQLDIAQHFGVSELTIRTLLVNHRRIDRSELQVELAEG